MATPPRSAALNDLSEPCRRPIGVRAPATMTEPFEKDIPSPNLSCDGDTILPMESLLTRIDHVGIAVPDLDEAIAFYGRAFGLSVLHEEVNERQGVREAMLGVGDSGLVHPAARPAQRRTRRSRSSSTAPARASSRSPTASTTSRRRPRRCGPPASACCTRPPRSAPPGSLVNFCHPKDCGGVLVELVQAAPGGHH